MGRAAQGFVVDMAEHLADRTGSRPTWIIPGTTRCTSAICSDMPPFGLAAATGVPAVESRGRRVAQWFARRSAGAAKKTT
ncbi:hypothetical protein ACFWWT_11585 [Streptomyces sp. NPDC058676]|uniref:hypothetical protein n=1 Tax=unclassified Streptomyces TaxID=2593676 RepID=UPI0036601A85